MDGFTLNSNVKQPTDAFPQNCTVLTSSIKTLDFNPASGWINNFLKNIKRKEEWGNM